MSIFEFYILFCLTTALVACYELLAPVVRKQKEANGKIENIVAIYVAFMCITILIAPIVFPSVIIPSFGESFRTSLAKGLFPED